MTIKQLILPSILVVLSSAMIWAGCKSDCRDEYESAVAACHQQIDDPDDVEDLQQCIQNAKDEYESCVDECDS